MENKKDEIIKEVLDEINSALKDPRGLKNASKKIGFFSIFRLC